MSRSSVNQRKERQKDARVARALVGRTIVEARPNACVEGENPILADWMHSWVLVLDDGTEVGFCVEEHPDGAEYGVDIFLRRPRVG